MIQIYTTFDAQNQTWNAMTMDNQCITYGSIDQLEQWLLDNSDLYYEV